MTPVPTLFVVKEDEEYCILFDREDPVSLFQALFDQADAPDLGITREDVFEVIEGMVPGRLRAI